MDKNIKLSIQQARDLYKINPEYRNTLLSVFTNEELGIEPVMKNWKELGKIRGFYLSDESKIEVQPLGDSNYKEYKALFATEKQARSALAMAQLSQLMADLGDECNVDWNNNSAKYVIYRDGVDIYKSIADNVYKFLSFKTAKVRDAFLEKHKELIKDYLMI